MPTGTGVAISANLPETNYQIDTEAFARMTQRKNFTPLNFADIGSAGGITQRDLSRQGILAWATVVFKGTLTTVKGTGTITTTRKWPYGLLRNLEVAANAQTGLINANGLDLHVRRLITNPAYEDNTDDFAGTVGGNNVLSDAADLTNDPLVLHWQGPVAMDRTTLVGSLYAQSQRANLTIKVDRAPNTDLLTLTGNAAATLTGTWFVHLETFDVPTGPDGSLIIPDLTRFHGFQAFDLPLTSTGESKHNLQQVNGQLARVLLQLRSNTNVIIDPAPANQPNFTALAFAFGGNERPWDWNPISLLLARNNEHYGARLPYGYVCLDFVRENALRDAVLMPGITDPRLMVTLDSSVTLTLGNVHIVQETLFV